MYVCTLPTSSTSSHFLFPLLYPLPYNHTSLFPPSHSSLTPHTPHPPHPHSHSSSYSSHSLLTPHPHPYTPHTPHITLTLNHTPHSSLTVTLTPHTPHTDTEKVFPLMVWVLDDRQKKQLHPLTPSHPHTEQSWSGYIWSVIYIT